MRAIYPLLDRDLARVATLIHGPFRERTEVPIESVGVVHVLTEVSNDDPGYAFTDVILTRYRDGEVTEHAPLAGSVCESAVARCMHEHWCDVERLIRCVQGDTATLCVLDIDWEIDDEDDPDPSPEGNSSADPGLTRRILDIAQRAQDTRVGDVPSSEA